MAGMVVNPQRNCDHAPCRIDTRKTRIPPSTHSPASPAMNMASMDAAEPPSLGILRARREPAPPSALAVPVALRLSASEPGARRAGTPSAHLTAHSDLSPPDAMAAILDAVIPLVCRHGLGLPCELGIGLPTLSARSVLPLLPRLAFGLGTRGSPGSLNSRKRKSWRQGFVSDVRVLDTGLRQRCTSHFADGSDGHHPA